MTDKKADLAALVAGAVEAEADADRHIMEEAVLATVARHGLDAQDLWHGFNALTWSRKDFAAIADALWEGIVEGVKPDAVLIRSKLKDARVEDAVLTGILDGSKVRDVSVAVAYVRRMEGQDRLVRAEAAGREYLAKVEKAKTEGGDVDAAVAGLLKDAFSLAKDKKLVREYPVEADGIADFLSDLDGRRTEGLLGLDCGFHHLNEVLNGLTTGVFILAGMPGSGKTTLAKAIADHVAAAEKVPVLFWSFEQSAEELRIKSLSRLAAEAGEGINARAIWKGRTDADTWAKVEKAAEAYRRGPGRWLTIIEAGREDVLDRIRSVAVMAQHKAGGKKVLLVLDYLQIIPGGPDAPEDTRARIDANLSELRRLARDLKSPILLISALSRAGYGKPSIPPTMDKLKESGGIEYTADGIICLWRDKEESDRMTRDYGRLTVRVEAHVLKNRNGEVGSKVKLDFTPAWAMFAEGEREDLGYNAALGE